MTLEPSDLLKELSSMHGVSGYEQAVQNLIEARFAPYVDEFQRDKLGNLLMLKRGNAPADAPRHSIMLAVHADEIGAIVTDIDRGFVKFYHVGGVDYRYLLGQEVTILAQTPLQGIIASRPPHFSDDDRSKYPSAGEYLIDLGLSHDEVTANVNVGDVIAVAKTPVHLLGDRISGKALDNRASLTALYICLQTLNALKHRWDVYAVATAQEELGGPGAITSVYNLNPGAAIAIDVTFADAPGIASGHNMEVGKGPVPAIGANIHPVMLKKIQKIGAELEIPLQIEPLPGNSGTDAWHTQISRDGVPSALVSIPIRYMHSPVETASIIDITRTGRLVAHFIASLKEDFITHLTPTDGLEA